MNKSVAVNVGGMTTTAQLHTALNAAFGFPDFYGGNFPALVDCWSSLRYPDDAMSELVLDGLEDSIELRVAGADSCSDDVLHTLLAAVTAVNHRAQLNGLDDVILVELASTHHKMEDPVSTAQATVVIDDQQVRVTTWTFDGTGDATGPHVHEYDYIVVPVTGGRFTVVDSDGATREMTQDAGSPYRGTAGTSHNVINSTGTRAVFVEIELKR